MQHGGLDSVSASRCLGVRGLLGETLAFTCHVHQCAHRREHSIEVIAVDLGVGWELHPRAQVSQRQGEHAATQTWRGRRSKLYHDGLDPQGTSQAWTDLR
ncbi:MAG: hypothetical protein DLM63_06225 [Solirubrobacterales bacterium]|nr:MAG: hypothetical protein DLM63_06225 [Solirubrobacterales bacterium]